jgi:hypothetical protein
MDESRVEEGINGGFGRKEEMLVPVGDYRFG